MFANFNCIFFLASGSKDEHQCSKCEESFPSLDALYKHFLSHGPPVGKSSGFATRVPTELGTPGAIDPDVECERLEDDLEPDRIDKVKTGNVIHGHLEIIFVVG